MQASPKRLRQGQQKVSNPPIFIWEPEPLVLDNDPVVDLSNPFSNLFLSSRAPPHVHYTTGLNESWAEQIYARLPLQPIGLLSLLVNHKVDPNAPLGSFENPYSSSNAPPLPQLHSYIPSLSNPSVSLTRLNQPIPLSHSSLADHHLRSEVIDVPQTIGNNPKAPQPNSNPPPPLHRQRQPTKH